ncbi:PVC-type heme-binding CxxCH protein [Neorhodopirellula pilleata]|uniref:NPCBM/NEW2 domain protein n=1 Tax=Neorhodopirellula pilleata TaxID=2714738 RepID=A0A5C6ARH3_9BACT|nr:PVC-type heme-binding CxxCH protein [Neorhodopirellula pilleata]TWU02081.1 NPCBM/NEW2 domain protein [Neorhodopirellula pilleata]
MRPATLHPRFHLITWQVLAALMLGIAWFCVLTEKNVWAAENGKAKNILMIAGPPSHGYGAHEHYAGLKVLEESLLEANPKLKVEVVRGWPEDASKIAAADSIVVYCDGGGRHVAMLHRDAIREVLKRGGGLVALHYAVEMVPGESGDDWVELLGGHFEIHYSVNPHWVAHFDAMPEHPITRSVDSFHADDEWYFNMRFSETGKLTPILQSVAPEETMRRPDGPHSGNPTVRKMVAAGEPQTVAWAYEPPFGGRSFGFTGGHYHWNWAQEPVRRLVTNAIRWTAGDEIESERSAMKKLQAEDLLKDQDYPKPKNLDLKEITKKFDLAVSGKDASGSGDGNPTLLAASPRVTTQTSRHQVELQVDLNKLDADRRLYLVVTQGGDSFACDHVAWIDPVLKGSKGAANLVDLDWVSATTGWGEVHKNANVSGRPVKVRGESISAPAIGTHAPSVICFEIPEGYESLTVIGALESDGTDQNEGNTTSVRFAIYTGGVPNDLQTLDENLPTGQRHPDNAIAGLEIAEGLEATLMGSEPNLKSLTNLDIDHRGRVWVCDVMNYRSRANARPEGDRILILEDTTGDGKLDKIKTFYQGPEVDSAMGICVLGNQVIVSASPTIWKFTDVDGDDVPDSKVAMFTETGQPQHDHSAHSFLFGPDGKLYWNFGNTGKQVKDADGETIVDIRGRAVVDNGQPLFGGMPFRCDLDGSNFEVLAHNFRNNWETTVDSFGSLWQSDNDDDGNRGTRINFVMEQGNYGYRDELTGAGWRDDRITLEEEIPLRHWHLNDPGVVPNLLQTGAGSPSGICMYEGRLLPERFWDQIIHCDPGPNVVRAYPSQPDGAGYSATIEPLMTGIADKWFRPADVCVAPDGSLFVTDWYDPGVGGHRQEDSDRGRLFRLAPPGVKYTVPQFDFKTAAGCAEALRNPNLSVRYMAWTGLHAMGHNPATASQAQAELEKLYADANPRVRARAMWLLGQIASDRVAFVQRVLADQDSDLRIAGIRLAKLIGLSVAEVCGGLVDDDSPAVRRELALAIRYDVTDAMPGVWAKLAARHDGSDRWYLEALGIGSDVRADDCFSAWSSLVGKNWNTPGGRDIVWRTRADAAAERIVELIADPKLSVEQTNRYFRALEYHKADVRAAALKKLLVNRSSEQETLVINDLGKTQSTALRSQAEQDEIIVRAVMRMPGEVNLAEFPKAEKAIERHIARSVGKEHYLKLVERFRPTGAEESIYAMMVQSGNDTLSMQAAQYLLKGNEGYQKFVGYLSTQPVDEAKRIASLLGTVGNQRAVKVLEKTMAQAELSYDVRAASVRALSKNNLGIESLLSLAESNTMPADLKLLAGGLLSTSPDKKIVERAARILPLPESSGSVKLAPLDQLAAMSGDLAHGLELFRGKGTCSKCHVVNGFGNQVGPDLSEIGSKLSREAMFTSILDPSAGISHNYENYIVLLDSGQIVSGILVTQTDEKLVVRNAEAIDIAIDPGDVEEMSKSEVSIMPANLHQTTDQQGLVDMVEYLMSLKKIQNLSE